MRMLTALIFALLLATGPAAFAAAAAHAQNPAVSVSGSVTSDCSISTDYAVSFASAYDPDNIFTTYSAYDQSAPSHVQLHCSKATQVAVYIDHGLYAGNSIGRTYGLRSMKQGPSNTGAPISYLTYHLCQDAGCAKEWGTSSDAGSGLAYGYLYQSGSDAQNNIAVYGRINGGQKVGAGSYSDLVTVSVLF